MIEYLSRETPALLFACTAAALFVASKLCLFNAHDARRSGASLSEQNREPAWGLASVALRYVAWGAGGVALASFLLNLLRVAQRP